jgi:hypothetical protein
MLRRRTYLILCLALFVASSSPSFANTATILDLRDWQTNHLNYDDAVIERCFAAKDTWGIYGVGGAGIYKEQEDDLTDDPAIILQTWRDEILNTSDVDLITHGDSEGSPAAEYYAGIGAASDAWDAYTDLQAGPYTADQITTGMVEDPAYTAYVISWTPQGIHDFLSGISSQAILYADYCHSCDSSEAWGMNLHEPWWGPVGGSMFCYADDQPNQPLTDYRENIYGAMSSLGCHLHPWRGSSVGDAEQEITDGGTDVDITVLGDRENSYHLDRDCHNVAAAFDGVFAFDGKVVFRTVREAGSICLFVMGLDSWGNARVSDWKSWDVLARVKPEGGRGVAQLYEVDGVPGKAVYRVVEVDRYGRPTFSPVFVRGTRPVEYDLWLAHPGITTTESDGRSASSELWQWISGRRVPYERQFALQRREGYTGRLDGGSIAGSRVDSTYCADVVVYTNADHDSLLPPVVNHLSNYPSKKVRYFLGGSRLDDAQACYNDVYMANFFYNYWSGTDRFPTDDPGPLLLIVGDSGMAPERKVVLHGSFADTYDRCYSGSCYSDRDATNVTGEGCIGLVHRIPGATVAEVTTACEGADDWNAGEYVDPGHQVIEIVGNELAGTVADWPVAMADRAASEFLGGGYLPKPVLVESDFGEGESKVAAFNAQLETGAAVLWGFGRVTGNYGYNYWPGHFVGYPDTTVHSVKQRMIALLPGCSTIAPWIGYSPFSAPRIERWMFNEPDLTQIVGGVGHLVGAWEHQHRKAEELYMAAWADAPEDVPLDWVVWRAARMAEEQGLDWMSEYFRSAVTVGGYVLCRPGEGSYTSVPEETDGSPTAWSLRQNAPNPFNPTTTLQYSVPGRGGHVRIDVYDAAGRHVATLVDADKAPGVYAAAWDGTNDSGVKVSSGVYFCRMKAPGFSEQRKLTILK